MGAWRVGQNRRVSEAVVPPSRAGEGEPAWFGPGVAGIGTASLLADVGHEVPTALLPSLVTSTLQAPAAALGVIEGVSDGLAGLARLAGGAIADDPALLADIVPAHAYGRAYGFERMMDNLGAIVGPLLALGLVAAVGVRWAIGLSVVPGLLAAAAIVYAIRHARVPADRKRVPLRIRVRPVLSGQLGRLLAAVAAFEVGNVAATLLILRATELLSPAHGTGTATTIAIGLYVAYNAAATLASVPAGRVSDRLGRSGPVRVLTTGVAAFAISYAVFAAAPASIAVLAVPFVLAGVAIGCVETAEHAAVAALAPEGFSGLDDPRPGRAHRNRRAPLTRGAGAGEHAGADATMSRG